MNINAASWVECCKQIASLFCKFDRFVIIPNCNQDDIKTTVLAAIKPVTDR